MFIYRHYILPHETGTVDRDWNQDITQKAAAGLLRGGRENGVNTGATVSPGDGKRMELGADLHGLCVSDGENPRGPRLVL